MPKLLRSAYMADHEGLLRETRATALYYFPGPVFALLVVLLLDYAAAALAYGWAAFPLLTNDVFGRFPTVSGHAPGTYLLTFFLLLTLLVVLLLLVRYLRWISTVYAVTTHRVIIQSGILSRTFDEIPVPQVRGVDVRQTIVQRMFHYGTVRVSSEGGATAIGNEDWEGIPRPFEFQRLIESANQAISRGAAGTWVAPPP
jgi:uncharacterized membrane protein YdbT with pleckstrin-like domain